MKHSMLPILVCLIALALPATAERSQYAGEETRSIKALSGTEIDDYLAGRGMGLAKAAELNGYPGPKHVMELGDELQLSDRQREQTARLFDAMQTEARHIGEQIIVKETALDALFAGESITPDSLAQLTAELSMLQGRLRTVHLGAHLAQRAILTPEQRRKYIHLRGYHQH